MDTDEKQINTDIFSLMLQWRFISSNDHSSFHCRLYPAGIFGYTDEIQIIYI